jgi:hypothetical protein
MDASSLDQSLPVFQNRAYVEQLSQLINCEELISSFNVDKKSQYEGLASAL